MERQEHTQMDKKERGEEEDDEGIFEDVEKRKKREVGCDLTSGEG